MDKGSPSSGGPTAPPDGLSHVQGADCSSDVRTSPQPLTLRHGPHLLAPNSFQCGGRDVATDDGPDALDGSSSLLRGGSRTSMGVNGSQQLRSRRLQQLLEARPVSILDSPAVIRGRISNGGGPQRVAGGRTEDDRNVV